MSSRLARLEPVWEVPLALLSFLFFKLMRLLFRPLIWLSDALNKKQTARWRITSAKEIRAPLVLPALMTQAPRWNTNAIIATAGPLEVEHSIRVQIESARRSAKSWTAVAHGFPMHEIGASINSSDAGPEPWQTLSVPPGRYRVVLRYYQWAPPIELPALEIDGRPVVPTTAVPAEINDFYRDLARKHTNLFYLCLHYYVGTLLRYQRRLPKDFVKHEYLPAGNPETEFYYGFLKRGQSLSVQLDERLLPAYDVYFNLYNRASFPLLWYQIQEREHVTPASPVDSTYLIRVHQKTPAAEPLAHDWVRLTVAS